MPKVLFEQPRPLYRHLDVVPDLRLPREAGKTGRQCLCDMLIEQLLAPVHQPDSPHAEQAWPSEPSSACKATYLGHGLGITAGVVEGDLEVEFPLMLTWLEINGNGVGWNILIGKDLLHLIKDLVILVDDLGAVRGRGPSPGSRLGMYVVDCCIGRSQGGFGFTLKLDDDGADGFWAIDSQYHLA